MIITDATGKVTGATPAAAQALGAATTCRDRVDASVCTATCVRELEPGEQRDHGVVRVRDRDARLRCSAVGDTRVIEVTPAQETLIPRLSPREREVLQLVSRGLTSHRIARRLGIAEATVCTHVEHARDKLGVRTRSQAVARALTLGWL
jgi:DNA-binding NarL/FixJ family response regulator